MFKNSGKRRSGFTLIELLVVIAIIGMLSAIILNSLNTAREQARDAERKEEFHQMATALELFYNQNGGYPATGASTVVIPSQAVRSNPNAGLLTAYYAMFTPLVTQGFLSVIPIDPLNIVFGQSPVGTPVGFSVSSIYYYFSDGTAGGTNAQHYLLCGWLENHSDPQSLQFVDIPDPLNPTNYLHANDGYSGYMYCVESPT